MRVLHPLFPKFNILGGLKDSWASKIWMGQVIIAILHRRSKATNLTNLDYP